MGANFAFTKKKRRLVIFRDEESDDEMIGNAIDRVLVTYYSECRALTRATPYCTSLKSYKLSPPGKCCTVFRSQNKKCIQVF